MIAILQPSLPAKIAAYAYNVLVLGVDESRALCLMANGSFEYWDLSAIVADIRFNPETKTWDDIEVIRGLEAGPDE